jgi:hypothetical protein
MTGAFCIFTVPEIEIVDERDKNVAEKSYEGGSTIQLKCLVSQVKIVNIFVAHVAFRGATSHSGAPRRSD